MSLYQNINELSNKKPEETEESEETEEQKEVVKRNNLCNYLEHILNKLRRPYDYPYNMCINENAEYIKSIMHEIEEFYMFLIEWKTFINKDEFYLLQIKELLKKMILCNNVIFHDSVFKNKEIGVSVIYLEDKNDEIIRPDVIFSRESVLFYYPELCI
tara:strand:- start:327 stop:800 length:474 start_codon:yes stop_codon:yes gene_type:complete